MSWSYLKNEFPDSKTYLKLSVIRGSLIKEGEIKKDIRLRSLLLFYSLNEKPMEQYYYTDGKERYGPFTLDQLRRRNIGLETLVWKEGMPDWSAAKNISDLQSLFQAADTFQPPVSIPYTPPYPDLPPKNWLLESILITIFCCLPLGIVGIINATKVETLWQTGNKDASIKASKEAAKWVKIGFFVGIACIGLYMLLVLFGVMAGIGSGLTQ